MRDAGIKKKSPKVPSRDLGNAKRSFVTTTPQQVRGSDIEDQATRVKDEAIRLKDQAANSLKKAKLAAEDVSVDLKEGAQEILHKTKKAAKSVKKAANQVAEDLMTPVGEIENSPEARASREKAEADKWKDPKRPA